MKTPLCHTTKQQASLGRWPTPDQDAHQAKVIVEGVIPNDVFFRHVLSTTTDKGHETGRVPGRPLAGETSLKAEKRDTYNLSG